MMGRIYSQTSKVIVWLGPSDDYVRSAFAFMRAWSKTLRQWGEQFGMSFGLDSLHPRLLAELDHVMKTALKLWNMRLAQPDDSDMPDNPNQTSRTLRTIDSNVFLKTVLDLFNDRPYWSIMWAFQEIYLPEDGMLLCGHDIVVGITEVLSVMFWLQSTGAHLVQQPRPDEISPSVWNVLHEIILNLPNLPLFKVLVFKFNLNRLKDDDPRKISELLRITQFRQATNPRDLYYGVMGVLELRLSIDYADPVESVLLDASRMLCQGGGDMLTYLLACAGSTTPRRELNLPSWVTARGTIEQLFRKDNFHVDSSAGGSDLLISWGQPNPPSVSSNGQVLVCTCVALDTIESEAVKTYRRDLDSFEQQSESAFADWATRVVDDSIAFFFDCPSGACLSENVASGVGYVGGGSQFSALVRFWLQDHIMIKPNEPRSSHDIIDEDPEHNDILEAAQLFLLLCLLRDRDVEWLEELQIKSKPSEQAFKKSILKTSRFILRGFSEYPKKDDNEAGHGQQKHAQNDPTGTAPSETISYDNVLRLTSYQKRSNPPSQGEIDDYYSTNFHLAFAALLKTQKGYIGVARAGVRAGIKCVCSPVTTCQSFSGFLVERIMSLCRMLSLWELYMEKYGSW